MEFGRKRAPQKNAAAPAAPAPAAAAVRRGKVPLTVCGKPLSPEDRKVWRQAIALLMGLKLRNGLGEKDLTAAVGTALHHGAGKRNCEDCGMTVAGGATLTPGGRGPTL